jgi:hypothetical protein
MDLDPQSGTIRINDRFTIPPYLPASEFLKSDLFRQYSMDQITLDGLEIRGKIVLKISGVLKFDWYFALDFKNQILRAIRFYLVHNSIAEIRQASEADLKFFGKLLKDSFPNYPARKDSMFGLEYNFKWGIVKSGTYPDGILAKIIVIYKK